MFDALEGVEDVVFLNGSPFEERHEGFLERNSSVALGQFEGAPEEFEGARGFSGALLFPADGGFAIVGPEFECNFYFRHVPSPIRRMNPSRNVVQQRSTYAARNAAIASTFMPRMLNTSKCQDVGFW